MADGADSRNRGSIQFLVGEIYSTWGRQLLAGANPVDLMHKVVNAMGVHSAPLVIDREKETNNERFWKLWKAVPKKREDMPEEERIKDEDDFAEYRRYKQLSAYECLFYDHGILTKQDVPSYDADRGD